VDLAKPTAFGDSERFPQLYARRAGTSAPVLKEAVDVFPKITAGRVSAAKADI